MSIGLFSFSHKTTYSSRKLHLSYTQVSHFATLLFVTAILCQKSRRKFRRPYYIIIYSVLAEIHSAILLQQLIGHQQIQS